MNLEEYVVVFWCCLGALCNSTLAFSLGVLQNYIYNAFLYYSPHPELMQSGEEVMHVFATTMLMVGCGFCWTLGYIKIIMSPRVFHAFATLTLIIATITLKWWYPTIVSFATYCVINGYITGVLHVYFSEVLSNLDESKAGLYNGLYGFFFGCSGLLANVIAAVYINPENRRVDQVLSIKKDFTHRIEEWLGHSFDKYNGTNFFDPSMMYRTSNTWIIYGLIFAACYLPGVYFISCRKKSPGRNRREYSDYYSATSDTLDLVNNEEPMTRQYNRQYGTNNNNNPLESLTNKKLNLGESCRVFFGSKEAYFYLSCTVSVGIASLVSSDLYKSYGMKVYHDDQFYNLAGTVVPVVGGAGRAIWGALFDHLPEKAIFSINTFILSASLVGMMFTRDLPFLYITLVATVSSSLGTMSCLAPAITKRFSTCSFSLLLGLAMSGEVLGTLLYMIVTSLLAQFLSDTATLAILAVPPGVTFILSLVTL